MGSRWIVLAALVLVVGVGVLALNWDRASRTPRLEGERADGPRAEIETPRGPDPGRLQDKTTPAGEPDGAAQALHAEARALAKVIRLKTERKRRAAQLFESGMITREELLLTTLDADLDRGAELLLRGAGFLPATEIAENALSLGSLYAKLLAAGGLASPTHRDSVAALKALSLSLRWFESPMGRPTGAESMEEAAASVGGESVEDAEREYLEAALARLENGDGAIPAVQRLLVEARLGKREFHEAHERAKKLAAEAARSLPTARQDDLDACLGLFGWYRFAAERRSALR